MTTVVEYQISTCYVKNHLCPHVLVKALDIFLGARKSSPSKFFFFKSGSIIVAEPGIYFSPALTEGQTFVPRIGNIQKMI